MSDRIQALKKKEWNWPLSRRVAQSLLTYDADAYRTLSVEARGNIVLLTGFAIDDETRQAAIDLAKETKGVAEVIDRITVRRKSKAPQLTARDISLATALDGDPLWQRSLVPVALCGLLVLIVFGWQWLPLGMIGTSLPDNYFVVEGSLFLDGQPATGAELTFYPLNSTESLTSRPKAVVGPDGRFSVETPDEGAGAPAGHYVVTARWSSEVKASGQAALPSHYADPRSSPLSAEVVPGDIVSLPPFELARAVNAMGKAS